MGSFCGGFESDLRNADERGNAASSALLAGILDEGVTGVFSNRSLLEVIWWVGKWGSVSLVGGVAGFEMNAVQAAVLQSGRMMGIGVAETRRMKRRRERLEVGFMVLML